jgi:hypothetical protein
MLKEIVAFGSRVRESVIHHLPPKQKARQIGARATLTVNRFGRTELHQVGADGQIHVIYGAPGRLDRAIGPH